MRLIPRTNNIPLPTIKYNHKTCGCPNSLKVRMKISASLEALLIVCIGERQILVISRKDCELLLNRFTCIHKFMNV